MTLDEKIINEPKRRSFLKKAGQYARDFLLGAALVTGIGCGGGPTQPSPPPSPTPPATYEKATRIIGSPSGTVYNPDARFLVQNGVATISQAELEAAGAPSARHAVATEEPVGGFVGDVVGAMRNGVMYAHFDADGYGQLIVAEAPDTVDCAVNSYGMGQDIIFGQVSGGGTTVVTRKIVPGETVLGETGADGPDSYVTNAMNKFNNLMMVGGQRILFLNYAKENPGATFLEGYLSSIHTMGLNGPKIFAAARSTGNPVNQVAVFMRETLEATLVPRVNNPVCGGEEPVWYNGAGEAAQYNQAAHDYAPMVGLYALAKRKGF
ncbi:hypothetical protein JW711_05460 [Candidatus Woesearchaeota archaeon]|nr:hypothetical protein [Candidatus Woesearchaeota archaeon]